MVFSSWTIHCNETVSWNHYERWGGKGFRELSGLGLQKCHWLTGSGQQPHLVLCTCWSLKGLWLRKEMVLLIPGFEFPWSIQLVQHSNKPVGQCLHLGAQLAPRLPWGDHWIGVHCCASTPGREVFFFPSLHWSNSLCEFSLYVPPRFVTILSFPR